uniref:Uncharacterized protein n=1 Tax=Graphocephala atropunctata TaxID=36148 RepID=A0A1B6M7L4_9HEMI
MSPPPHRSSPLHRMTGGKDDGSGEDSDASRSRRSRQDGDCECAGGRVRSLADSLRSPSNGFPAPKSPVFRQINDTGMSCKGRSPPPPLAPKPRPWSMAGSDRKSGDFCGLLSDGSSPNTSAANTPDSGDALEDGADTASIGSASSDKRSVRELAASLNKHSDKKQEPSNQPLNKPKSVFQCNASLDKVVLKAQDEESRQRLLAFAAASAAQHFHFDDSVDV